MSYPRSEGSTLDSPAQGSHTRKTSTQNIWFWKPVGLTFRRAGGLKETETLLLKGVCKNSFTPSTSTEAAIWKAPGSDQLADLGEPPREAGGNWDSPGDIDAGGSPYCKLILLCWYWHWQIPFWNPPFSLLALGTTQPTSAPIAVVSRQVAQPAMPEACPTYQCTCSIKHHQIAQPARPGANHACQRTSSS